MKNLLKSQYQKLTIAHGKYGRINNSGTYRFIRCFKFRSSQVDELVERIAEANLSLPTPIVSVEEINSVNNTVNVIESESSF